MCIVVTLRLQSLVGAFHPLERRFVAAVGVGVNLLYLRPIGALDRIVARVWVESEDIVRLAPGERLSRRRGGTRGASRRTGAHAVGDAAASVTPSSTASGAGPNSLPGAGLDATRRVLPHQVRRRRERKRQEQQEQLADERHDYEDHRQASEHRRESEDESVPVHVPVSGCHDCKRPGEICRPRGDRKIHDR